MWWCVVILCFVVLSLSASCFFYIHLFFDNDVLSKDQIPNSLLFGMCCQHNWVNNEVDEKGPAVSFAAHPPHQQPFGSASRPSQQPSSNMLVHHPYQQVPMLRPPSAPAVEFKPYDGTTKNKTFSLQLEPDKGGSVSVSVPSSSSSSSSSSSVRVRPLASAAASIIRSGDGSAPSPPSHKQNPFLSGSSPK